MSSEITDDVTFMYTQRPKFVKEFFFLRATALIKQAYNNYVLWHNNLQKNVLVFYMNKRDQSFHTRSCLKEKVNSLHKQSSNYCNVLILYTNYIKITKTCITHLTVALFALIKKIIVKKYH